MLFVILYACQTNEVHTRKMYPAGPILFGDAFLVFVEKCIL